MAFINKLFPSRTRRNASVFGQQRSQCGASKYNACAPLFTFTTEQVQIAVFRECDFRGRKLLFDSKSVLKVQLDAQDAPQKDQFVEVTNGFGYTTSKPNTDLAQLREMIFGSVAMTFRGTLYKIHHLALPSRLVLSQVFPSPRVRASAPHSALHMTAVSLDHSFRLDDLPESAGSSQASYSDHSNSDQSSTASDTLLICRRQQSVPLDVPSSIGISSSGYNSLHSGPQSMPMDLGMSASFSDHVTHRSLPTSMCLGEEVRMLRHRRGSKLGLAIVLELTQGQECELERFLMQHIAFLETLLWRVRQSVEIAYIHHHTFVSSMHEVSMATAELFVDFLAHLQYSTHAWTQLNACDIPISIRCDAERLHAQGQYVNAGVLRTLTKRWFRQPSPSGCEHLGGFVKDLCELVEYYDVKQTNFFLSTLMTGVLTHHLGWVATILPPDEIRCARSPNLVVRQLCDLYGCVGGAPTKMAHTIIAGGTRPEVVRKFVDVLTYFVRGAAIRTRSAVRTEVDAENIACAASSDNNSERNNSANIPMQPAEIVTVPPPSPHRPAMGMKKSRTCLGDLNRLVEEPGKELDAANDDMNGARVLFVLGENEKLENLTKEKEDVFLESDFACNHNSALIQPSASFVHRSAPEVVANAARAQSEEPSSAATELPKKSAAKYRYSGVKFNFQQYPQIFENYMKSKNIELSHMQLQDKKDVLCAAQQQSYASVDFSQFDSSDSDGDDDEPPLQTPSNASELEYASELVVDAPCRAKAKELVERERVQLDFTRCALHDTLVMPFEHCATALKITELPMPRFQYKDEETLQFTNTLIRSCGGNYLPNMVLQGLVNPAKDWQSMLKRDLILAAKHPIAGEPVEEAVALVGNIDTWSVNVISSHTYVIDKHVGGVPIGMSQLVGNMLETLLKMWKLRTPPEYCIMHIEQKLREFCTQSKALAQMLLDTEYCTIELLTSALKLEVNDVPLLMAVASIHTPEVTQKYGLRFQ